MGNKALINQVIRGEYMPHFLYVGGSVLIFPIDADLEKVKQVEKALEEEKWINEKREEASHVWTLPRLTQELE